VLVLNKADIIIIIISLKINLFWPGYSWKISIKQHSLIKCFRVVLEGQQHGFILIDSEIHLLIFAIKSFKYLGARRFIQVEMKHPCFPYVSGHTGEITSHNGFSLQELINKSSDCICFYAWRQDNTTLLFHAVFLVFCLITLCFLDIWGVTVSPS
jgi:hypothetical protein